MLPSLSALVRAQSQQAVQVRPGVFVIDADGSNVLVCATRDGLVLVDSGNASYREQLLVQLAALSDKGVHTLFNTHWHAAQCGANEALGSKGAKIMAHQKTWHHLATDYYLPPEQRYHQALPAAGRPTVKFYQPGSLQVGEQHIDYAPLLQAHTDGDSYFYLRDANVLAVGGAAAGGLDPELDWYGGGWLGGRADSLNLLVQLTNADTLIVPARGKVMTQAELIAERDMTQELYKRLRDLIRKGCSAECMAQEGALSGLSHTWQDPQTFLYAAYKGLWAHHYNLSADLL